jgi:hypothetical protein
VKNQLLRSKFPTHRNREFFSRIRDTSPTGLKAIGVAKEEGDTSPIAEEGPRSQKSRSKATAPAQAPTEVALGSQPVSRAVRTAGNESQENRSAKQEGAAKRPGKVDQILALVKRPEGANIEELTAVTGWQAHSVRAALSGLRKRDIAVGSERQDGVTRYRVAAA